MTTYTPSLPHLFRFILYSRNESLGPTTWKEKGIRPHLSLFLESRFIKAGTAKPGRPEGGGSSRREMGSALRVVPRV